MALIKKISYKVDGDYYQPKNTAKAVSAPRQAARPAPAPVYNEPSQRSSVTVPPPVINNQYTRGEAAIPGMAGYKITQKPKPASTAAGSNIKKTSQLLSFFDSLFKPVAPQQYSSAPAGSSPYMNGVQPIPGMAGWKIPQREQGVGFQPSKQSQVESFIDKYFGSISYPDYAATAYKSAPQTTIPKPVRPGSEPIPYQYPIYPSQTTIPQPAHPGWNPQAYKYPMYPSQTTIPQPARPGSNAPIASPWVTAAKANLMAQQDRYAGLGKNSPVVSEPTVKYVGLGNQPYNGYNQFDPQSRYVPTPAQTPQANVVEDRFSRGNFLPSQRTMTLYDMPGAKKPQDYFSRVVLNGRTYSVPNRMLTFASDYPWETANNWFEPPAGYVDTAQQWGDLFGTPWQVNPIVDNSAFEPIAEGGAGGWGYGGGYGGYGGSSHYNSNPNYIGSNRGYAQTHRQNMLLWNI